VYTGDFRFHGRNRDLTEKFVKKAVAAKPKWMLCEGTRINSDRIDSEFEVQETISKWISEAKGLVFIEHPIRDLDRIYSLYLAAKENNREFVIPTKLAALIETLGEFCPLKIDEVKIYTPRKGWGLIYKENFEKYQIKLDYSTSWEKRFLDYKNTIKADEIAKNLQKYVVSMSMWEIGNLIDIKPKNATWIKSSCEPFTEEMIIDAKRKRNWLKHFGIIELSKHASGHASGIEIIEMIKKINPDEIIPIHTEHPEAFKKSKEEWLIWIEQERKTEKEE
jgi:ribonuclease J